MGWLLHNMGNIINKLMNYRVFYAQQLNSVGELDAALAEILMGPRMLSKIKAVGL